MVITANADGVPCGVGRPDDITLRFESGPTWSMAMCSTRGGAHVETGRPRQDACAHALSPGGDHLVMAVADGVGSRQRSEYGARQAAWTACQSIAAVADAVEPGELDSAAVLALTEARVRQEAARLGIDPDELATTLLVAVIPLESTHGMRRVRVIACGDSDAYHLCRETNRLRRLNGDRKSVV